MVILEPYSSEIRHRTTDPGKDKAQKNEQTAPLKILAHEINAFIIYEYTSAVSSTD